MVVASEELKAPLASGVELCYQTFGNPADDPLLLVMGLSGPMIWWDVAFCEMLAERGFFVIRYDNRDTGRSGRSTGRVTRRMLVRAFVRRGGTSPYSLADLADDAFGLLDHLGIDAANVAGISMGGMIAQEMAIRAPRRVLSLVSIMSTTGRRSVGWQDPKLLPRLLAPRKGGRDEYVATSAKMWQLIGSPAFPFVPETLATRAGDTFDRGISASGVLRQMQAILTAPDRTQALRSLQIPAAVVHGTNDRMVHVSGGRATAAAIPGSELVLVDGMGHDLPPELFEEFTDVIRRTADRAGSKADSKADSKVGKNLTLGE